ncbi:aconitase X catalytic domain-containing protein [Defluviimonas sp. WL0024]|uniref:Aconitase X catalytic domain-containing protein n=1 Tax=Albidovulum salinarum TaxID=2984153 RepID=A0ABT2X9P2_9RHOB|nr:aconitase X catalytic domain-containing protein [Defluviimonas sp. WL0024]MCU9850340.1 aconitase X catalytic domain-containing protein [Defluviimonas sp. WL0024]
MNLSDTERSVLAGETGTRGDQMAMEIVAEAARMLGADRLVEVSSSHIDGCLYHGDSGVLFCEKLAEQGARVKVPSTTNVGALNLLKGNQVHLPPEQRKMAYRLMVAHDKMGCIPSWTCAPYQAGARPALGQQVAWGESNAVAFTNTVLGARTNRYGDFLDIACAISARAPYYGLHKPENRVAELLLDVSDLPRALLREDAFFPVLGSMIGRLAGESICVVDGMPSGARDDQLKAMCAGAASTGAVALIHVAGITPEAPDAATALGGNAPKETITVTRDMVIAARDRLSLTEPGPIDCVALGSPHFSNDECRKLLTLAGGEKFAVPVYVCTGRHTMAALEADAADAALRDLGVEFVVDTCVVVTPILPAEPGVMMTNSAKFAHYATGNTGYAPVFGSLTDCVRSARAGRVIRDQGIWG